MSSSLEGETLVSCAMIELNLPGVLLKLPSEVKFMENVSFTVGELPLAGIVCGVLKLMTTPLPPVVVLPGVASVVPPNSILLIYAPLTTPLQVNLSESTVMPVTVQVFVDHERHCVREVAARAAVRRRGGTGELQSADDSRQCKCPRLHRRRARTDEADDRKACRRYPSGYVAVFDALNAGNVKVLPARVPACAVYEVAAAPGPGDRRGRARPTCAGYRRGGRESAVTVGRERSAPAVGVVIVNVPAGAQPTVNGPACALVRGDAQS